MYIDTHAHLDFPEYKAEVTAVLGRAKESGVGKIINVGVDFATSKKSVEIARQNPEVYAAIGLHPDSAGDLDMETRSLLTTLAGQKKVVAIGEIGLDYYYLKRASRFAKYPKREEQIFCFEQMLDLAIELRLPVIVHSRESEADTISILKSYKDSIRAVMHCFSGDYEYAAKILDMGFLISFTGNITFNKNTQAADVIKKIPLGSIMIETDSPFLAPEPHRGDRNEPAFVVEVARKISEIKDLPLAEVERSTTKRAESFFRLT
ncbi:MAG: TatD family hydrolase [Patescibacteria group bacterium]|jgi:TatD DNase family protein